MIRRPARHGWAALLVALVAFATISGLGATARATEPIRVGISLSQTGPAASLGIPQRNTVALLPKKLAVGPKEYAIDYVVLDDASDSSRGAANARKLADEDKVDVIVGSTTTPASLQMIGVARDKRIPMISLAASAKVIENSAAPDAATHWVFKTPQNDSLMADAIAQHMREKKIGKVAFIGFNDAYGDGWLAEVTRAFKGGDGRAAIELVDTERYARTDTSVTGQVLKMVAANPEAVLIAASGTPAALPQKTLKERGYRGTIYQTHGVANPDFLRVGGRDVEGTILPAGPVLVAAQLPDSDPVKPVGIRYTDEYDAKYGKGSMATFGAHLFDAWLLLEQAIPIALKAGEPGTDAFHAGLRDALEGLHGVRLTHGIATISPQDHNGFAAKPDCARVMVTIETGAWKVLEQPKCS